MSDLDKFLKENELVFGDKYKISPSPKFTVLREALLNYYETYASGYRDDNMKTGHFSVLPRNNEVVLKTAFSHDYIVNCYNSIIHLQMFLELYIIDFIEEVHPVFTRGKLNKEIDLINAILVNFDASDYVQKGTVNFSQVLNRLELLLENHSELPSSLQIDSKYHFFKDHIETIKSILNLRNRMLHKGNGLLKDFALDVLWVNHVIPILIKILEIEETPDVYIDRKTHCGIQVITELNKLTIDQNYNVKSKIDELNTVINHICHLKELGRASHNSNIHIGDSENNRYDDLMEQNHNSYVRSEIEFKAKLFRESMNYFECHTCPCCGAESLLTYQPRTIIAEQKQKLHNAECIQCSYFINSDISEPKMYNIIEQELFIYLDNE